MTKKTFKDAKNKWLEEKDKYDEAVRLYESILNVLQFQQEALNKAFHEFINEQAEQIKELKNSRHFKDVKEEKN